MAGNPLAYEDCNDRGRHYEYAKISGNPLAYEDCNKKSISSGLNAQDWQPTCLRGLQLQNIRNL